MQRSVYLGVQFDPASIAGVAAEIQRQAAARQDYIFGANRLSYTDDGALVLKADKTFKVQGQHFTEWAEAEAKADALGVQVEVCKDGAELPLNGTAWSQLRGVLGVPAAFERNLKERNLGKLIAHNVREILGTEKRSFLVRTMSEAEGGKRYVRAILSDKYKVLDNLDLFLAAAETFREELEPGKPRAQLWKARLTDNNFDMFGASPHIAGEVRLDRPFNPGDGWMSRWVGKDGDTHNAAVRISNSETGEGGLAVEISVFRRVCQNFCTWGDRVATIHLGRAQGESGLVLSHETLATEAKLTWMKIKDAIKTAFDPEKFATLIAKLNDATQQVLPNPQKAVDSVVARYEISDERKALILGELLVSGDVSRFGLVQAVTWASHTVEKTDPTAAAAMEKAGGELVTMESGKFAELVGA